MDTSDKRDLMAAMIIQSVMIDKLKWLGEHSRKQNSERLEGLLDDALRDLVTGTYVLVDEMLRQSAIPNMLQVRLGQDGHAATKLSPGGLAGKVGATAALAEATAARAAATTASAHATAAKAEASAAKPESAANPKDDDMDGARSDLFPISS